MSRILLHVGLVALLGAAGSAQTRDAAAVLADMRKALGGDAVLDAVQTLSASGSLIESGARVRSRGYAVELFVMLPGHFMYVTREVTVDGPSPTDRISYRGFRADERIRWTEPAMPLPDSRPEAAVNKREFARLFLALFGKSPEAYPLQFTYVGTERVDKQQTEVLGVTAADGFEMRLSVDQSTHLPVQMSWHSQTTFISRNGNARLVFSDFRRRDGVNWPHRLVEFVGPQVIEDTRLLTININPKIDARRFNVGK